MGEGRETERLLMDPEAGSYGCVVPAGSWHTIVALEPTVIMEVKDGRYGEDGSYLGEVCFCIQESESEV